MNKKMIIGGVLVVLIIALVIINPFKVFKDRDDDILYYDNSEFYVKFIQKSNQRRNYIISPYSVLMAINMLRDGADGQTKKEIDDMIGEVEINKIAVGDNVKIANAAFIKKDIIVSDYVYHLKDNYNAEVIYDENMTPDIINNWVKANTNEMIDKVIDNLTPNFVMGLANAVAIDVKWQSGFTCDKTTVATFMKYDNTKYNVEMMHQVYDENNKASYLENDEMKGIVIPYKSDGDAKLEFVALLPKMNIDDYIKNLTTDKLNYLNENIKTSSNDFHISLSLPRFSYEYSVDNLRNVLQALGMISAFRENQADFSRMSDYSLYVSDAYHKAKIGLNEEGTKAAAVTYFSLDEKSMVMDNVNTKTLLFNKPFIYMIRDKETGEILFFGSVYEPNEWKGSTCE